MTEAARSLATKEGLERFVAILNAQYAWSAMTGPQRAALVSRLHSPVARQTLAALERRGMVSDGLVTEWGDWVRVVNHPNHVDGSTT